MSLECRVPHPIYTVVRCVQRPNHGAHHSAGGYTWSDDEIALLAQHDAAAEDRPAERMSVYAAALIKVCNYIDTLRERESNGENWIAAFRGAHHEFGLSYSLSAFDLGLNCTHLQTRAEPAPLASLGYVVRETWAGISLGPVWVGWHWYRHRKVSK